MDDSNFLNEPATIAGLSADTRELGFAMASEPLTGSLLRTLAASKPGGRFLELGSGTGLSTAWLLDGMDPRASLLTVDYDASLLAVLKRHLGPDPRLTVVCEDADAFVRSLSGRQFDFIFADTWAGKYRLLDETLDLLAPAGLYVVDDMLPRPDWPEGHAEKAATLASKLEQREDLRITRLSWATGIILAAKFQGARSRASDGLATGSRP